MKDPNRLYTFYNEIARIHMEQFPGWDFLQLMVTFYTWIHLQWNEDPFFLKDDRALELFREFANIEGTTKEG